MISSINAYLYDCKRKAEQAGFSHYGAAEEGETTFAKLWYLMKGSRSQEHFPIKKNVVLMRLFKN